MTTIVFSPELTDSIIHNLHSNGPISIRHEGATWQVRLSDMDRNGFCADRLSKYGDSECRMYSYALFEKGEFELA